MLRVYSAILQCSIRSFLFLIPLIHIFPSSSIACSVDSETELLTLANPFNNVNHSLLKVYLTRGCSTSVEERNFVRGNDESFYVENRRRYVCDKFPTHVASTELLFHNRRIVFAFGRAIGMEGGY